MKNDLFEIAAAMRGTVPDAFAAACLAQAHRYRGLADLMVMWASAEDESEQGEIIADIGELLDEIGAPSEHRHARYVRFDDLDAIAANIMDFKDKLRLEVEKRTTLTELSEKTGMPLPSLSRFFSQPSMPRRSTLLKIADALDLSAVEIANDWTVA